MSKGKRVNFWFTPEQTELLENIKDKKGLKNAEVIRESMKVYAELEDIEFNNVDAVSPGGTPLARTREAKLKDRPMVSTATSLDASSSSGAGTEPTLADTNINDRIVKFNEVTQNIKQWLADRQITSNSTSQAQFIKTVEEVGELASGLARNDKAMIEDAIGDVIVTLIAVATLEGTDIEKCMKLAYNEIKDRKGYLNSDGIFIKEEK